MKDRITPSRLCALLALLAFLAGLAGVQRPDMDQMDWLLLGLACIAAGIVLG